MIFFLVSTSSIDSLIIGRNLPTMVCLFYLLVLSLCIYFLYLYDDIWKPRTRNLKMETISKILNCRIRRGLKLKHWEFICVEVLIPSIYLEFHVLIKKLMAFMQGEIYMMHEIRRVCVYVWGVWVCLCVHPGICMALSCSSPVGILYVNFFVYHEEDL